MVIVTRALTASGLKAVLFAIFASLIVSGVATAADLPPTISGTPKTSIVLGTTYSFTPAAKDPEGKELHFVIQNRPSWATFSYGTGGLYGKPTKTGTWSDIIISVSDGTNYAHLAKFSIKVTSSTTNRAPTISGTPPTSVTVGGTYSFKPTASDPDGNTLGFSIANKPAWLAFNTSTGQVWGQPTSSNVGSYGNIVITVSDGKVSAKLPAFSIAVKSSSSGNTAPKISGTPGTSAKVGIEYSFQSVGSDANGDTLTYSITNKPAWAYFNPITGRMAGTPTASHVGTYSNIVIKVSDGKATASLPAFAINVAAAGTSTGAATLSWTPPTRNTDGTVLTNLAGYRIYYGTNSSSLSRTITINNASVSRYVVDDLSPATYYFAIRSFNSKGVESTLSNKVSKVVK